MANGEILSAGKPVGISLGNYLYGIFGYLYLAATSLYAEILAEGIANHEIEQVVATQCV